MHRNASRPVGVGHEKIAPVQTVIPRFPAHGIAQTGADEILQFHTGKIAQHQRGDVRGRRGIRITFARPTPKRDVQRGAVEITDILTRDGFEGLGFAIGDGGRRLPLAPVTGAHAKEMSQFDIGLSRIIQRESLGQELFSKDFGVEAVWDFVVKLPQHHAAGDAGESFSSRGHVGVAVARGAAKVFLVDEIALAHHEQSAVLSASLTHFKRRFQAGQIHPGFLANLSRILQSAPTTLTVRRRKIRGGLESDCTAKEARLEPRSKAGEVHELRAKVENCDPSWRSEPFESGTAW